jgi:hypothetical protein
MKLTPDLPCHPIFGAKARVRIILIFVPLSRYVFSSRRGEATRKNGHRWVSALNSPFWVMGDAGF